MNTSGAITVCFFTISMLCHVEVMFIQLLHLINKVLCLFTVVTPKNFVYKYYYYVLIF